MTADPRWLVFARLWGIALVAHVVGNAHQPDLPELVGLTNLVVGWSAVALAVAPSRALLLWCSAWCVASVLAEMPVTGNHWFVAGLVSLSALATAARPERFFPTARLVLLVFYFFAAFAKLNSGFLDPAVSCGVHFVDQWLSGFGLGPVARDSWLGHAAVWGPTLTELTVPVLLIWRPARPFGVLLATFFHTSISYDIHQHFYDFTSVLLPLFFLFVPATMARSAADAFVGFPKWLRRAVAIGFAATAVVLVALASVPSTASTRLGLGAIPFVFWLPFSLWWMLTLVRSLGAGDRLAWRPPAIGWAIVVLAFLNGLTPYLEVKTGFGFNMYANLITANGESNHFVVRRTLPLRDGYDRPVTIVDSSDDELMTYAREGYRIAYPEFRRYLHAHPDTRVTFERDGLRREVARAGDDPVLAAPVPWWWRFFPLRSLDVQRPPRCQDVFQAAL